MKYIGGKYYYIKQLRPYFQKYNYDNLVDCFGGSGTISLNFNSNGITYLNELDQKIFYIYYNIKYHFNEFINHFNRYKKLFCNKQNNFIENYLNIILNKLKFSDIELSVLLILIPKLTYCGKIPFSKIRQKFNKINLISVDFIDRNKRRYHPSGFLLTDKKFNDIENEINNFSNTLTKTEIYNLDYQEFIKTLIKENKIYKEKSLIYLDPPYFNTANLYFQNNSETFEIDLLEFLKYLDNNGFKFIMSNSYNETILNLFNCFSIETIKRFDCLKAICNKDSDAKECVIFN